MRTSRLSQLQRPAMTDHCIHPTGDVVYYSEIEDDGRVYEEYWCRRCNFWLTSGAMDEIRERPDWNGGITEDDIRRETKVND